VQVTVARAADQEVDAWDNHPPSPSDLASSSFVQSSDPVIESLAVELIGSETSPVELIAALAQGVSERVLSAGLGAKPSSAEQTARRMEGDQISRAILLVGLLRNRGVPARLVSGLRVASEQPPRLVFDVWVEAWLETGWRAVDATSGQEVTCGYVRMRTSSLNEPNIYQAFLPSLEAAQSVSRATLLDAETINAASF
jgi:transglutaminase-like putative cysteine protease